MALMRVNKQSGRCNCTNCGANVMWVRHPASTMKGNWAGVINAGHADHSSPEAYDGGLRNVCTVPVGTAVLHACGGRQQEAMAQKYGRSFELVRQAIGGTKPAGIPATPTEPPVPLPKPKPHKCPHCDLSFYKERTLEVHMRAKHADKSEPKAPEKGDKPSMPNKTDGVGPIEQFIEAQIQERIGDAMDEAKVQALVDEAIAKVKPEVRTHVVIEPKDGGPKVKVGDYVHKAFDEAFWYLSAGSYVYLFGEKGSGKSTLARQLATALSREFFEMTFGPADTPTTIRGFRDATGTVWETEAIKAMKTGGLLHIDEGDNGNPGAWVTINNALSNGWMSSPEGTFKIHDDFLLIVSGNTRLRGGEAGHATRRALDSATSDRFEYVEVLYDSKLESDVARQHAGDNVEISAPWVAWVQSIRNWGRQNTQGTWIVSPRTSYKGARLLAQCPKRFTKKAVEMVADATAFKGMDDDMKKRVLEAHPLPTVEVKG